MRRLTNQQSMNTIWLHQLPVCQVCELTEEMAKCDIYQSQKQKCNLVMCKKCQQKYPQKQCDQAATGCKKKVKQHRLKNRFKQKIKNTINSRFQLESKLRKQLISDKYASKIDEDMAHILAALLGENNRIFNTTYKKDIDKLVEELKRNQFTIESQVNRGNLPVYKATIQNNGVENDGKIACGYPHEDYSKGINQIFQCFF